MLTHHRSHFVGILLVTATCMLALAGCKAADPAETYRNGVTAAVRKHGPAVESTVAALEAIRTAASANPAYAAIPDARQPTADNVIAAFDADLGLKSPSATSAICWPGSMYMDEALRVTREGPNLKFSPLADSVASIVDRIERNLQAAGTVTHALVCRRLSEEAIVVRGDTFTGGRFSGECRLYDVKTKELLGGFPVSGSLGDSETKRGMGFTLAEKLNDETARALPKALVNRPAQPDIAWRCRSQKE